MLNRDVIKSLIALKQLEMPFKVIHRDAELPTDKRKIITIPGVRRCGKSTMMMIAINSLLQQGVPAEKILWLGFDDERLKNMDSSDLDDIITSYMEMFPEIPIAEVHMFFDEIQIIKDWEYFVLRLYKTYCQNIYVCGSNATMLSTELNTALRGYPLEYETFPLSFNEYCRFRNIPTSGYLEQEIAQIKNAFEAYVHASAFPEVVLTDSETEKLKVLHGYFDTLLLKDIAEHYQISNVAVLRYFVKRIMANLTKPTSILSIYNDIKSQGLKIGKDDLYRWANHITDTFLFIRIPKYEHSLAKEQKALPKYYCIDNGLRNAVLLPQSDDNGKLLENIVLLHLHRNLRPSKKISYFQETSAECDFMLQQNGEVHQLIQVCWDMSDESTRKREINGILAAAKSTGCHNLCIITLNEEGLIQQQEAQIKVVSAWKWMLGR